MSCISNTEKYASLVSKFLKIDPVKYSNFDNVAEFILSNPLKDNSKTNTLHHLAVIYSQLEDATNGEIKRGKAEAIKTLVNFIGVDDKVYLEKVLKDIYPTTKKVNVSKKQVIKQFNKLAQYKELTTLNEELMPLFDLINKYLSFNKFKDSETKQSEISEFEILYENMIANTPNELALRSLYKANVRIKTSESNFIALNSIELENELQNIVDNRVLLQYKNGNYIDAYFENGNYYDIETGQELDTTDVISKKILLNQAFANTKSESFENVFFENFIATGINVKDVDPFVQLNTVTNPLSEVTVKAVPLPESTDNRISLFNDIAESDPLYKNLANRKHETFESLQQISHLEKNKDAVVGVLYSPKKSENDFVLVGEFNGKRFMIYTLDNFAFLDSNNKTTKIDFTNNDHLATVANTFKKVDSASKQNVELTTDELMNELKGAFQTFLNFKNDILKNSELSEALSNGETVDVSEVFHSYYNVNSSNTTKKDFTNLEDVLKSENSNLYLPLEVIDVTDNSISFINVPLIGLRRADIDTFTIYNPLSNNQRIYYNNKPVSFETYVEQVLLKNESFDSFVKSILTKNDQLQEKVLLTFENNELTNKYRALNIDVKNNNILKNFTQFITSLVTTLDSESRTKTLRSFAQNYFQFLNRNSELTKRAVLNFNFSVGVSNELVLEIRPYATNDRYSFINSNKIKYNIPLPETKIKNIYNKLASQGFSVEAIKEAQESFNDIIEEHVLSALRNPERIDEKFGELFREDFTINDKFVPEYIFLQYDLKNKRSYLKIYKSKNNKLPLPNLQFENSDIYIVDVALGKKSIISPKTSKEIVSLPVNITPEKLITETKAAEEKLYEEFINNGGNNSTDAEDIEFDEDIPFKLMDSNYNPISAQEQETEIGWLEATYPKFNISSMDMEDIMALTKLNTAVLGFFKDKTVFLNKTLKSKGVVYHEAFHGVFQYLMNEAERRKLLNSVINNKEHADAFTEDNITKFAEERNYAFSKEELIDRIAEEILANGFQQYMINKKAPTTLIEKFFKLLENIIRMFNSNQRLIDSTFKKVANGYYNTRSMQELANNTAASYLAVPGLNIIYNDAVTSKVKAKPSMLASSELNQLTNMLVYNIIKDEQNKRLTFKQKFDQASDSLLETVYNINVLTAQTDNEAIKKELIEEFGDLYNQYRFVLGARMKGKDVYDINHSGNSKYNTKTYKNQYKDSLLNIVKPNLLGEYSYELLEKLTEYKYNTINSLLSEKDQDGSSVNLEEIESTFSEDGIKAVKDENDFTSEEVDTDETESFDNFVEKNALDSIPRQIKRFLAINTYNLEHPVHKGIYIPRVINGIEIFSSLLKISSDVNYNKIIEQMQNASETMIEDGNYEIGNDIKTVYENLKRFTGIKDDNGKPVKNKQLYNMFIEALHATSLQYSLFTTEIEKVQENELDINSPITTRIKSIGVKDKVLYEDINQKKKDIVDQFLVAYSNNYNNADYKNAIANLKSEINNIKTKSYILESVENNDNVLIKMTNTLHDNMKKIGFNIPKSLIRLSLIGIDTFENENDVILYDPYIKEHYEINKSYIDGNKYLNKKFFNDLYEILSGTPSPEVLSDNFSDSSKKYGGFNSVLRRASEYIIKYDPSSLPSVVRNAEGKLIYRYVKYTPLLHMVKSYNKDGFLNVIKDDVDYEKFLKDFYKNHPTLSVLLVEDKSTLTPEQLELYNRMDTFVRNMNVSLYGGAQLIEAGNVINSSSYYNLEKTSSHLLALFSFLKREKIYVGDSFIETYNRQHAQNETSPTNFLISGMHESFANEQGPVLVDGRLKIVETFKDVIAQEYARIAREWANKKTYKENFLKKKSNYLRTGYNAKRKGNDIVVDDKSFKAYNFSKLSKFFQAFPDINDMLKDNAFTGTKFEDLSNVTLDNGQNALEYLLDALNDYAIQQYQYHLDIYTASGIIQKVEVAELASPFVTADNKLIPKLKGGRKQLNTVYKSDYFTSETPLIIGYDKLSLGDIYGSYNTSNKKYGALNDKNEPVYIVKDFNVENFLMDYVFNHMHNSLLYNQLFDGDESLISKDDVDIVKRNKRFLISGNNFKNGYFRAAFIENLQTFLHPDYAKYGHYNSLDEIKNDIRLDNATRAVLEESFVNNEHRAELADGQSWSTIAHQIDQFETTGKLSDQSLEILIAKHYRDITEDEFRTLQKDRIVLNPKKTATGSRTVYLKLSETYIDRNDVSYIPIPEDLTEDEKLEYLENVYKILNGLYTKIYSNRKLIQDMWNNKDYSRIKTLEKEIRTAAEQAHSYFESKPGRRDLHVMLNSMEYYNIDMIMDNNASKSSKVFPVEFSSQVNDDVNYIDVSISSLDISNEFKYNQVETSRMKDESKVSIQRKVLLPADIRHLEKALGRTFEGQELKNYQHILSVLDDYNMAMKESADAAYNNLRTFLRDENNNYDLGKIYDIIRENLELQDSPDSIKELFTTDANGQIIINPNIPAVREIIQYYFFALYSKATDEKSSGKKYILASSYGYDMIVDDNDNIIPEAELEANPEFYKNFRKRPLTVTTEIDENGFTRYYIEVLVPKPYFKDAQDELFYLENLNKFFATRIPTENKRSMAIFKAVGFINSAHGNAIIVPQLVHHLSGSDLDIDTVYTQMYNYYENFNNQKVLFGDYSTYANEQEGKFIEYLLYKLNDNDLNNLVNHKIKEIQDTENYKYSEAAKKIARMLGYNDQQIDIVTSTKKDDLFEAVKMMKQNRDDIFEQINNIKKAADFENLKALAKNKNKTARKKLNELYEVTNPLYDKVNQILQDKSIAYSSFELYYILNKLEAIVKVYSKNKLPVSLTAFNKNKDYANSIRSIAQNKLLKATDELLSTEMLFDNLYINQKSSTVDFDNVLTNQGRDYKNVSKIFPYDHHSIAGVINSKSMSQSDKANVGRSANMNKTIAFINENTNTGEPNIKDENIVFKYLVPTIDEKTNKIVYKKVSLATYGIVDNVDELVIKKVGDAIGMFTDAAKEPKPALLGINDANSNFILSTLGLGLNDDLAFNLIRLPEFIKATEEVLNSEKTVNINPSGKVSIDAALTKQINMLKTKSPDAFSKLKSAGLIPVTTSEKSNNFTVIKENVIIDFTPTTLDLSKIENNTLSLSDLGITVSALERKTKDVVKNKKVTTVTESENVINLTEDEQKIILLHYIREQNRQSFQLSQVSSLVNTLKSLKPSMSSIDFMYNNIKALKNNMLFLTPEVVDNIFSNTKVWNTQLAILEDFMEQAELLFLERSNLFKGMTNLFNTSFKDKSVIASTLATTLAIYKFKKEYPGSRLGVSDTQTELIREDDHNLQETFTARYWFTHGLDIELEQMKAKYPNNKFLQYLRSFTTKNFAKTSDGRKYYEKYIGLITKAKIKGDIAKDISDDAKVLISTENMFMNKLFYHELARTSLQYKNSSFLKFLDAAYYKQISSYMNELTDKLKDENINLVKTIKDFINADNEQEFINVIDEVFEVIANTSYDELVNYSKPKFYFFDGHSNTSFVNKKIETEDKVKRTLEYKNVLLPYLNNIVVASVDSPAFTVTSNNLIEFNDRNRYVGFDFSYNSEDVNATFKSVIARNFNIKLNPVTLDYIFPAIIKINNRLYLLQKVFDNESSLSAKSKSLGETFVLNTTYINNEGAKAVYKKLGDSIVNFQTTLNPGSLSKEELVAYSELIKTSKMRSKNLRFLDVEDAVIEEETPINLGVQQQAPTTTSTELKGNIQLELIEDLVQEGKAKTTVRNYDRASGVYKSSKTNNLYNLVNRGKVKMVDNKIVGENVSYTLDEFGAAEGFNNWEGFTKAAKFAGKDLMAGKEVFLYDISPAGKATDKTRPVFDSLPGKSATPTMTYAGIGSRETPAAVLEAMTKVAEYLDKQGFTLNTGKTFPAKPSTDPKYQKQYEERLAFSKKHNGKVGLDEEGADRAFSLGATKKNLFGVDKPIGQREMTVMQEIHPNPSALKEGAKKLMARNTNQVFGKNLDTPVDFVLFYAKETSNPLRVEGGTGQAVEMARRKGIPTINMANPNWRQELNRVLSGITQAPVSKETKAPIKQVFKIGQYVSYKKDDDVFIVTKVLDDGKYQIYNPTKEGAEAKLAVKSESILPFRTLFANIVELNPGESYIVTPKDTIISLTTNKIMKFLPNDGKRLKILALAKGVESTQAVPYESMSAKDQWLNYGPRLIEKFGPGLEDVWEQRDQDFRNFKIKCL